MQELDWLSAILAFILTAGIAAAQGTETNSAVPSTAPISLPGEGLAQHPFLYCGEVTPAKRVVWALPDWKTLGPASTIQLMDEPGVPEKGDLQR
jgi:hypothetical protein